MSAYGAIRDRIRRFGPIPFADYLELALYGPDGGFYTTGGRAGRGGGGRGGGGRGGGGRGGDFLTSPEIGPLFGAVMARALDHWWEELGGPDPFVVAEAAAGAGTLAAAVLAARPRCAPALRYLLVERSDRLRELQPAALPIEPAAMVLGPMGTEDDDEGEGPRGLPGRGPRAGSLEDLPAGPITGVIFANELLDNLPFALLERAPKGWSEVRVGEADDQSALVEVLTPAGAGDAELADSLVPDAPFGSRIPLQLPAATWLRDALRVLQRGRLVLVDYAATTSELSRRPQAEWLRTYRRGGPGGGPLDRPGSQDLTCEVCVDQLARVQVPAADRSQAEFLEAHGLATVVDAARAEWQAGAAAGTLDSLKARSRIDEAAALTDPAGLGAFRVLEWTIR